MKMADLRHGLQFLCPLERQIDLCRWRFLGLLDEGSQDHDPLLLGRDIERASDAGFALQADLPDLSANVAHEVKPPTAAVQRAATTRPVGSNSRKCGSPASPTCSSNRSCVNATAGLLDDVPRNILE
jgi:hypothetical protein